MNVILHGKENIKVPKHPTNRQRHSNVLFSVNSFGAHFNERRNMHDS